MKYIKKIFYALVTPLVGKLIPFNLYNRCMLLACRSKAVGFFLDAVLRLIARGEIRATREYFHENESRVAHILSFLEDEESKDTYRSLIQYRSTHKRRYINPHIQKRETFYVGEERTAPSQAEVFIDGGAFSGETSLLFQEACACAGQPAPQCVLIEPGVDNFAQLQKNLPKFTEKPFLFQMGLWSQAGRLNFTSGNFDSDRIDPAGPISVLVDTLDHMLATIPELPPVTYLKIDVEGADLDTIYGARETIEKYHPYIAISIYHKDEHMIDIPEAIHEMFPAYRFYVRHYTCYVADTILYCVWGA